MKKTMLKNILKEINLESKCGWYSISRNQRHHEKENGLRKKGTMAYEGTGCYQCNGHNTECDIYFSPLKQYKKGFNKNIIRGYD